MPAGRTPDRPGDQPGLHAPAASAVLARLCQHAARGRRAQSPKRFSLDLVNPNGTSSLDVAADNYFERSATTIPLKRGASEIRSAPTSQPPYASACKYGDCANTCGRRLRRRQAAPCKKNAPITSGRFVVTGRQAGSAYLRRRATKPRPLSARPTRASEAGSGTAAANVWFASAWNTT